MPDSGIQQRMGLETVIAILTRLEKRVQEVDEKLDERHETVSDKIDAQGKQIELKLSGLATDRDKLHGAVGFVRAVGGSIAAILTAATMGIAGFMFSQALHINSIDSDIKRLDTRVDSNKEDLKSAKEDFGSRFNAQAARLTSAETKLQSVDLTQISNDHAQLATNKDDISKLKGDISDIQSVQRRHDDELISLTTIGTAAPTPSQKSAKH